MNYYVIRAKRQWYRRNLPDLRTARIVSAHAEIATAERMAEGLRAQKSDNEFVGIYTRTALPKRLRKTLA